MSEPNTPWLAYAILEYFQDPCFLQLFFFKVAKLNPFLYIRIIVSCGHSEEDKTVCRKPEEELLEDQRRRLSHNSWPNTSSYQTVSNDIITASSSCPSIGRNISKQSDRPIISLWGSYDKVWRMVLVIKHLLPDTCYLIHITQNMLLDIWFLICIAQYLLSDQCYSIPPNLLT